MRSPVSLVMKVMFLAVLFHLTLLHREIALQCGARLFDTALFLTAEPDVPHPLWVLSWSKSAMVILLILAHAVGALAVVGRSLRLKSSLAACFAVVMLDLAVVVALGWPEFSYALGDRRRNAEFDNQIVRFLATFPGGLLGQGVVTAILQTGFVSAILSTLGSRQKTL